MHIGGKGKGVRIAVWLTHMSVAGWNFEERHAAQIQAVWPEAVISVAANRNEFVAALRQAEIALVWQFEQEWFAAAPVLKMIVTPAAGRDFLDNIEPPTDVTVEFSAFHGELMGETVAAMILSVLRGVLAAYALQQTVNPWPRETLAGRMRPLRGSRVMIAGFGNIGSWTGRLLKPFGVHLTGVRRSAAKVPAYFDPDDRLITAGQVDRELGGTDVLVLCLPGGKATDNWLSAARIALLPEHAVIINVGRGNALDEVALIKALEAGRLGAACLDVFREEPLPPDSPLRCCPRCYLMPHASAIAPNYLDLFVREFIAKVSG